MKDVLSEIMRVLRLTGAVFIRTKFTAPWCFQSPLAETVAPVIAPGANRAAVFYLVTEGECFIELDERPPVRLVAGDVVIIPHGNAHRVGSTPGLQPADRRTLKDVLLRRPRQIVYGGGGAATRIVCGYLAHETQPGSCMVCEMMPVVVRANVRDSAAGRWLEASVDYAASEAGKRQPGGSGVLARLAEVLFIETLRLYLAKQSGAEQNGGNAGWLTPGGNDRIVGAALKAMHDQPAHPWTLAQLARNVGTSRSVLAERFQQRIGSSPMQHLTQWRMQLAANLLRDTDAPLVRIAEDVGYQTDTAFSRAFRREYGMPPAAWRRRRTAHAPAAWQHLAFGWDGTLTDSTARILAAIRAAAGKVGLLDYLAATFPVEICSILLLNAAGTHFEAETYAGAMALSLPDSEWPITQGAAGRAVREGRPQLITDVDIDPDYIAGNPRVRAEYIVPIRFRDRILGCLNLESARRDCFNDHNQKVFRRFADQMAGAINLPAVEQATAC